MKVYSQAKHTTEVSPENDTLDNIPERLKDALRTIQRLVHTKLVELTAQSS